MSSENETRQRKSGAGEKIEQAKEAMLRKQKSMSEEEMKMRQTVIAMSEKAPPWAVEYVKKVAPALSWIFVIIKTGLPYLIIAAKLVYTFCSKLHPNFLRAICGFIMCFFGGFFPTLIAAYEAFREAGWTTMRQAIQDIAEEVKQLIIENEEDDKKDDDKDGKADVSQIDSHELMLRKTALVLKKVNADKVNNALSGMYMSMIAVAAVLKVRFARTIALGITIGDHVKPVAETVLKPLLAASMPEEYHQWIPIIINYVCKSIAMSIAWYIQSILSAVHSAIRGGLMCSRGLMQYAHNQGWEVGFEIDHEKTMIDEYAGWGLAALGFLFQMSFNFALPFPLNFLFWPVTFTEYVIRWQISDF